MPRLYEPDFYAPVPTGITRFLRTFLPWQLVRFAWINLKMVRMISIGHHGRAPLRPIAWPEESKPGDRRP